MFPICFIFRPCCNHYLEYLPFAARLLLLFVLLDSRLSILIRYRL